MKNINYTIQGVLAAAVIVLFVLHFSERKKEINEVNTVMTDGSTERLPMAYVNVDTLMMNYAFAKDMNEVLLSKVESSRATVRQKTQNLQAEILDFRKKVENNAFHSRERAEQEQARIEKKGRDLEELSARTQNEFEIEASRINQQVSDTVIYRLNEYNKSKNYQIIFSNTGKDVILFADEIYNITDEMLEYLNTNYVPATK
ncbi:membrane protein [Bacteroidales bacterium]|nr:membrane protein [Bacteroidales bacterium]